MYRIIYLVLFSIVCSAPVSEPLAKRVAESIIIERFDSFNGNMYSISEIEIIQENQRTNATVLKVAFNIEKKGFGTIVKGSTTLMIPE